jgi:hypothetical protein
VRRRGALVFVPNSIKNTKGHPDFDNVSLALEAFGHFLNYPMVVLGADDNKWKIERIQGNLIPRKIPKPPTKSIPRPQPTQEKKA